MTDRRLRWSVAIYLVLLLGVVAYLMSGDGEEEVGLDDALWVRFEGRADDALGWSFYPLEAAVPAAPGETVQILYRVESLSDRPATARASFTVDPPERAGDVRIAQCFCYGPERVRPGEVRFLPVTFVVADDVPEGFGTVGVAMTLEEVDDPAPADAGPRAAATGPAGILEVLVTDDREAIDEFRMVGVQIVAVGLHAAGTPWHEGWTAYDVADGAIDLTKLADGSTRAIFRGPVPAGAYDAARLAIDQVVATPVGKSTTRNMPFSDSPVLLDFTVGAGETATITFDLSVYDRTDHPEETYRVLIKELLGASGEQVLKMTETP